jgi:uncharacterized membrane protein YkoI
MRHCRLSFLIYALAVAGSDIARPAGIAAQDQNSEGRAGDFRREGSGWGTTTAELAREAVLQGWALPLSSILPTVLKAVPGQVLEVDLSQSQSGEWRYEFLVLTKDRRYQQILVDARRNQILAISPR